MTGGQGVVSSSLATRTKNPVTATVTGFFIFPKHGLKLSKKAVYCPSIAHYFAALTMPK
nr:MAG TPA: hypothetical protein [Caudoviricetes sp.]